MPKKQTPKQIHQQYKIVDDEFRVGISQKYIKVAEEWKFAGYICIACNNGFKYESTLTKHKNNCKVLNRIKDSK